eukprot:1378501-Pyramimonas_sp.AAC.1
MPRQILIPVALCSPQYAPLKAAPHSAPPKAAPSDRKTCQTFNVKQHDTNRVRGAPKWVGLC